jgi:phosphatidate cytidylyltransferase
MIELGLWANPTFVKIAWSVLGFLTAVGVFVFVMQRRNMKWTGAWASVKSWLITTPLVLFAVALPDPWPFLMVVLLAIYGSKTFFRMTGMYHRSWFVWATYTAIGLQGYLVYQSYERFFNVMPMIFFFALNLIPILRNSATHMIQYVALTLMNFIFFGWGFLHLARIIRWENGLLVALHVVILSEFSAACMHWGHRLFGRTKPFTNISVRFSLEGYVFSALLTIFLAFGLRGLLPHRAEPYWLLTSLSVLLLGRIGSLTMSYIRRDLGIKGTGVFIIGRDDLLSRVDGLMFVAPAVFYGLLFLNSLR